MDKLLIERVISEGDHRAFERLMDLYQSPVRLFLRKLCNYDTSQADDLAQETFLQAFRYLSSYRGEGSFKGWLFTIAFQKHAALLRSQKLTLVFDEPLVTTYEAPSNTVTHSDKLDIAKLISKLPQKDQLLVIMNFQFGLTHQEISAVTQLPLGTVKTRIKRALLSLRGYIGTAQEIAHHE